MATTGQDPRVPRADQQEPELAVTTNDQLQTAPSLSVHTALRSQTEAGNTVDELRVRAEQLLAICNQRLMHVAGIKKLRKKLEAELAFFAKFQRTNEAGSELKCSNLPQLEGVVECLHGMADVPVETMRNYKTPPSCERKINLLVDVVTSNGSVWRKIVARNPTALVRDWKGQGEFKRRSLIAQVDDYLKMAGHHPVKYKRPRIYFHFILGVGKEMADYLQSRGIEVVGTRLEDVDVVDCDEDDDWTIPDDSSDEEEYFEKTNLSHEDESLRAIDNILGVSECVNLDITAGIALISELCHGGCHFTFVDSVLTEQAEQERRQPVLPPLQNFIGDKNMYMCRTAARELKQIVDTIGGENERQRWEELMSRVHVVDDSMSGRTEKLVCQGKVKERSRVIFGTGDSLRAVTITANSGFVRAAHGQGVDYTVHLHEARALTEMKESTGTPIPHS